MTYIEQLRHPLWQKKRLFILNRDNFTCRFCGDKQTELHIHHEEYSGSAWEAPDDKLKTTCKHCHLLIEYIKKRGSVNFCQVIKDEVKGADSDWVDMYAIEKYGYHVYVYKITEDGVKFIHSIHKNFIDKLSTLLSVISNG